MHPMKPLARILLLLSFLVGLASIASAAPRLELGVRGGIGTSTFLGHDLRGPMDIPSRWVPGMTLRGGSVEQSVSEPKTGYSAGAYCEAHWNPRFGLRVEALFTRKGAGGEIDGRVEATDFSGPYPSDYTFAAGGENQLTIDYYEFPILGVATIPLGRSVGIDVFAGPSFAFKKDASLESKVKIHLDDPPYYEETVTYDLNDRVAGTDVGAVFGGDLKIHVSRLVLRTEIRLTTGLTRAEKSGVSDWKNFAAAGSLGLGIAL